MISDGVSGRNEIRMSLSNLRTKSKAIQLCTFRLQRLVLGNHVSKRFHHVRLILGIEYGWSLPFSVKKVDVDKFPPNYRETQMFRNPSIVLGTFPNGGLE